MRSLAPSVALSVALSAVAPARAAPAEVAAAAPPRTVTVAGEGRASSPPDVGVVTVGVEAVAKTLRQATDDANQRMRRVLDAVARSGVASKDVRTTRYDVSVDRPWKDGKPGPIVSYTVSTAAEVRVRDLAKLGAVLDAATAAGSDAVGGLRLEKADPSGDRARALAAAYADARGRAEALAKAAGGALGDVVAISESVAMRPILRAAEGMVAARAAAPTPVSTGEIETVADVSAVFALR